MQVEPTAIPEVKIVTPKKFGDHRGFFSEVWSRKAWREAGFDCDFVQDNHSFSAEAGVIRGLHFQTAAFRAGQAGAGGARPHPRRRRRSAPQLADLGKPCRGRAFGGELAAVAGPRSVSRTASALWSRYGGALQGDECLFARPTTWASPSTIPISAIDWRVDPAKAVLSDKDRRHPRLADLGAHLRVSADAHLSSPARRVRSSARCASAPRTASRSSRSGGPGLDLADRQPRSATPSTIETADIDRQRRRLYGRRQGGIRGGAGDAHQRRRRRAVARPPRERSARRSSIFPPIMCSTARSTAPIVEEDPTAPARRLWPLETRWRAGGRRRQSATAAILRTAWVYSARSGQFRQNHAAPWRDARRAFGSSPTSAAPDLGARHRRRHHRRRANRSLARAGAGEIRASST